jgi:hypothetical protein
MSFTPNYLSQRDSKWINEKLGFDDTVTIGTDGSTLVCLTTLVNGYGFNETPSSMNRKLKDMGSGIGFLGSLIVWPGLTRAFPQIVFRRIVVCRDQPAPLDEINTSLDSGQPLVIEIDRSPSPGLQNHWVVLYARQGDDYLMLDPWPQPPDNAPSNLAGRYGFGRPLNEFISAIAWYDAIGSPAPTPAQTTDLNPAAEPLPALTPVPTPLPAPTTSQEPTQPPTPVPPPGAVPQLLRVLVSSQASAGLRLRDRPSDNGNILEVLMPGTVMTVLEPAAAAQAKIGVVNQWLNVKLPGGMIGFVAAWYVTI